MILDNKVIKSMIAVPVGFIVLKDSTVVNRFYNNNYPSIRDELLKRDLDLFLSFTNNSNKRTTSFIVLDNILHVLYSRTRYKSKFFFVSKEDLCSLIYIDSDLYQELTKTIDINKSIDTLHNDSRIEIILLRDK